MFIIDAHCDTITKIMEDGSGLFENKSHVDLLRMKKNSPFIQFFAAFIDPIYAQSCAVRRTLEIIDAFYLQLKCNKEHMQLCLSYDDVEKAILEKRIGAILSIEDGAALEGKLSTLRMYYRLGVRSLCLTWNHRNEIADGVEDQASGGGLTPFGREVVREMNRLGMLTDVSHLSQKGFWDVIEVSKLPIIASHSNARSVCSHQRNLTDEQLLALKKNGGVTGINLYPCFLNDGEKAGLSDIIKHIEHIASITGYDHIGLGADFDGTESTPEGIDGVQDIYKIFNELARLNYSEEFLQKFAGQNFARVLKTVLRGEGCT